MQSSEYSKSNIDASLGIFTTVALVLALWGACWYKSYSPLGKQQYINVLFSQISGLNENAVVLVDGVPIGCVDKIQLQDQNKVLVSLRINKEKIAIPFGSKFNIRANGVIGAKYVDIQLPLTTNSDEPTLPIDNNSIIIGENTIRPEIIFEKLSTDLDSLDTNEIKGALKEDRRALHKIADQFSTLVTKTVPVLDRTLPLENNIDTLSIDMRKTLKKINEFSDNPKLSGDLKDTINKLSDAAKNAQSTVHELNLTLTDDSIQTNLKNNLSQLKEASENIEKSTDTLQQISADNQLRKDLKQIMQDAREATQTLDEIFKQPTSNSNVKETLSKAITTLADVDLVARQLNQILNKRHPLIHMVFGHPGYIKTEHTEVEVHDQIK